MMVALKRSKPRSSRGSNLHFTNEKPSVSPTFSLKNHDFSIPIFYVEYTWFPNVFFLFWRQGGQSTFSSFLSSCFPHKLQKKERKVKMGKWPFLHIPSSPVTSQVQNGGRRRKRLFFLGPNREGRYRFLFLFFLPPSLGKKITSTRNNFCFLCQKRFKKHCY